MVVIHKLQFALLTNKSRFHVGDINPFPLPYLIHSIKQGWTTD